MRVTVRDPRAAAAAAAAAGVDGVLGAPRGAYTERAARRRTWVSPPATGGRHFWEDRAEWSAEVAGEAAEAALPRAGPAGGDADGGGDASLRPSLPSASSFTSLASLASARASVIMDVDAAAAAEEEEEEGGGAAGAAGGVSGGGAPGGAVFDGVPLRSVVRLELCRHSRTRGEVIVLRKFRSIAWP